MRKVRRWLNAHTNYVLMVVVSVLCAVGWVAYQHAWSKGPTPSPTSCCPVQRKAGKQLMEAGMMTLAWDRVRAMLDENDRGEYKLEGMKVVDDGVIVTVSIRGQVKRFHVGWDFNKVTALTPPAEPRGSEK